MRGLTDEPLYGNQTLCDRINCEQEALKRHSPEKRGPGWGDQASCGDLVAIDSEPDVRQRPSFISTSSGYDRARSVGPQLEPVCKALGDNEECCTGVYKEFNFLGAAGWPT